MALIKCHECCSKVSTDAAACPRCGAAPRPPQPGQKRSNAIGFVKLVLISVAAFVAYNAYSNWSDARAAKKAEVSEFMRRNSLTSEQRIAEDATKANKLAVEKAERERIARVEAANAFKGACREALARTLYDPGAAQITGNFGSADKNGTYEGYLEGRAKNAFGAYVFGKWTCTAHASGENIVVTEIHQYNP